MEPGSNTIGKLQGVPGFLTKTYDIFSELEHQEFCGWGVNGDTIVVRKSDLFAKHILPKYFKHSNFQSFVRQLNMYDFRKTQQDPNHNEFMHANFKRGRMDLLVHIKRKVNKPSDTVGGATKKSSAASREAASKKHDLDTDGLIESGASTNPLVSPSYMGGVAFDSKSQLSQLDLLSSAGSALSEMASRPQPTNARKSVEQRLMMAETKSARLESEVDQVRHFREITLYLIAVVSVSVEWCIEKPLCPYLLASDPTVALASHIATILTITMQPPSHCSVNSCDGW